MNRTHQPFRREAVQLAMVLCCQDSVIQTRARFLLSLSYVNTKFFPSAERLVWNEYFVEDVKGGAPLRPDRQALHLCL